MKKTIRLTESDLHRIVKESVNRILNEGEKVNNKPYFLTRQHFDGRTSDKYGYSYVKPGERAGISKNDYDDVVKQHEDYLTQEPTTNDYINVSKSSPERYKHNKRAKKYDEDGLLIGSPEWNLKQAKERKKGREFVAAMNRKYADWEPPVDDDRDDERRAERRWEEEFMRHYAG